MAEVINIAEKTKAIIITDKEYLEWVKDIIVRYRPNQIKSAVKVNRGAAGFEFFYIF